MKIDLVGTSPSRAGGSSRRRLFPALVAGVLAALLGGSALDADAACTGRCAGRNWCEDRTHTCAGGAGKCLVKRFGGNICAEILFQAKTCADCAAPGCVNCVCVLAAGGGNKCNNGVNGFDYICVRPALP